MWTEISRSTTAGGEELVLRFRGGVYEIRCNGWDLMSNRAHASEQTMARLALAEIAARESPRVLIGGLGMGFTLRAALDVAPAHTAIEVAELTPAIVAWNRGPLAPLAGRPLDDSRALVRVVDVRDALAAAPGRYDAILLDTDNGPGAVMVAGNARLYLREGLDLTRRALAPGGVLAYWSADRSEAFEGLLDACGLDWRVVETPAREGRDRPLHAIYLARERATA